LSASEALEHLDAEYRPPVAQGDLYRAAREKPWAVAIIDGHFEHVPAVWHKEILWALTHGIQVYGAASMGALRAAELARYGMIGVGRVFHDLLEGRLEDDDEVAVAEAISPGGVATASVAMVDIRATLEAARSAQVIDEAAQRTLLGLAKATFYAERSYARLLADAEGAGFAPKNLAPLRAWLPQGQVAQKRSDAIELLTRIAAERASAAPFVAKFHFERTDMWHKLESSLRSPSACGGTPCDPAGTAVEALLDDAGSYRELETRALIRALVSEIARFEGAVEAPAAVEAAAVHFRSERGLLDTKTLAAWLAARSWAPETFVAAMQDDARLARLQLLLQDEVAEQLTNELQRDPRWPRLFERALYKNELLARHGVSDPDPNDPRLSLAVAEQALSDLDLSLPAAASPAARTRLILREAWFRRLT